MLKSKNITFGSSALFTLGRMLWLITEHTLNFYFRTVEFATFILNFCFDFDIIKSYCFEFKNSYVM